MIKGVNKRIVEVNDTDSKYFEKILFFVKSDCNYSNSVELENEAKRIVKKYQITKNKKMKRVLFNSIIRFAAGAAAGAGLAALLINI